MSVSGGDRGHDPDDGLAVRQGALELQDRLVDGQRTAPRRTSPRLFILTDYDSRVRRAVDV